MKLDRFVDNIHSIASDSKNIRNTLVFSQNAVIYLKVNLFFFLLLIEVSQSLLEELE